MVQVREGIASIGVQHRVNEDDGVAQHFHCCRVIPCCEMLEELECSFASRELEAVDRAAVPGNDWLVGDDGTRLLGRRAPRVGKSERCFADFFKACVVLRGGNHGQQERAPFPAEALPNHAHPRRCGGETLKVRLHLVVDGDALTERMPTDVAESGNGLRGGVCRLRVQYRQPRDDGEQREHRGDSVGGATQWLREPKAEWGCGVSGHASVLWS